MNFRFFISLEISNWFTTDYAGRFTYFPAWKVFGFHLLASKNARAKPGGVMERNIALSLDGGSRHNLLPSVGSTGFFSGSIKCPHRQVFLVHGSP